MGKNIWSEISTVVLSLGICILVYFLGSVFSAPSIPTQYAELNKPFFNPPNWVFGPVWTILFISMAISAYLILRKGLRNRRVLLAISIFCLQLLLNLGWSFIFFGRHNLPLAFTEILFLWFAILLTIIYFYRLSKTAGWLLVPYLLWVSFAAVLNFAFWRLNP